MSTDRHKISRTFPAYGVVGLLLLLGTLACSLFDHWNPAQSAIAHRVSTFTTAGCWWGYILFVDAWIHRIQGHSLLSDRRRTFWLMLPLSIVFWVSFEVYNFHLRNWHYEGLSAHYAERIIASGIAFATVLPGVFLTAEWLEAVGLFRRLRTAPVRVTSKLLYTCVFFGSVGIVVPLLMEREVAKYMFAFVWLGFVFLLDPLNYANGQPSLLGDLERGSFTRVASLFVAGLLCGLWWESWNYLAATKWVYDAPFTPGITIFEMPLAGFLGFGPFGWELYAMYHFARTIDRSSLGRPQREIRLDQPDSLREPPWVDRTQ